MSSIATEEARPYTVGMQGFSWIFVAVLPCACLTKQEPAPPLPIQQTQAAAQDLVPGPPTAAACVGPGPQAKQAIARNVAGAALAPCPSKLRTGFYRDGYCSTGADDHGVHVICARVTDAFLQFSKAQGNDLIAPRGDFPGLKANDAWCLCASRWQEAANAGVAPLVVLPATDARALKYVDAKTLQAHATHEETP